MPLGEGNNLKYLRLSREGGGEGASLQCHWERGNNLAGVNTSGRGRGGC